MERGVWNHFEIMKKQLVFLHPQYPAHFGPISQFLLKEYDVDIAFLSQAATRLPSAGIRHHFYKVLQTPLGENPLCVFAEESALMQGVAQALETLKLTPDAFIGNAALTRLSLLHQAYPDVARIGFFEGFYDGWRNHPVQPNRPRVSLRNSPQLAELAVCTRAYSSTVFQKSTYPPTCQDKLSVLFEGVDTGFYCPDSLPKQTELPITWPPGAKVITYVSRGLDALHGFDIFMEVAHQLSQKREDVHFVIVGNPKTGNAPEIAGLWGETFKGFVLKKQPFALERFHFLTGISEAALVDLYRLSDCHFYWTAPFTVSKSLFQAMATGCLVVSSDTAPVRDVIDDNLNGLLVSSHDTDAMVDLILDALEKPKHYKHLREAAWQKMVKQFSLEVCLPQLADFYLNYRVESPASCNWMVTSV